MEKRVIHNPDKKPGAYFSWGLELSRVDRLLFLTGTTAAGADGAIAHPNDAPGQARWILESLGRLLAEAGYAFSDVVRVETTVVESLSPDDLAEIGRVSAEYFGGLPVRPAAGTLRVVSRLIRPGVLIEMELIAAR